MESCGLPPSSKLLPAPGRLRKGREEREEGETERKKSL